MTNEQVKYNHKTSITLSSLVPRRSLSIGQRFWNVRQFFPWDPYITEVRCALPSTQGLNCRVFYSARCWRGRCTYPETMTCIKFRVVAILAQDQAHLHDKLWACKGGTISKTKEWARPCSSDCKVCS